jgi:AraC family transcriptional regulator, exoenzyme S synthesis regulatory protein ExsA
MEASIVKADKITSCYLGPAISPEQFIPEHFFLYLIKGKIEGFDGYRKSTLEPGQYCIARRNHLARYSKQKDGGNFEKVVVIFDQPFLKTYQEKQQIEAARTEDNRAFIALSKNEKVPDFLQSLMPYYHGEGRLEEVVSNLKREELLTILLQTNPGLQNVLFDFGQPDKIDLEAFMNRNYKFNVKLERFAYLTGRSLSAFKRDFYAIFNTTPGQWLLQRRLQEARFLLQQKNVKVSDIYFDLGFENLSHFSFAFKKHFESSPTEIASAPPLVR